MIKKSRLISCYISYFIMRGCDCIAFFKLIKICINLCVPNLWMVQIPVKHVIKFEPM